jgi:hypothetical protein
MELYLINFAMGIVSGIIIQVIYNDITMTLYIEKKYRKPFLKLYQRGLNIYRFGYRVGNYVVIDYDINNNILLDLSKKTISVFEDNNMILSNHPKVKEFEFFYQELVKEFHFEIYDNIVVFGDKIYSKNIFKQMNLNPKNTEKSEDLDIVNNKVTNFNLDDILDKISEKGIKSLSKEEKSFLNNFNKE